jgi:hypothetical protein
MLITGDTGVPAHLRNGLNECDTLTDDELAFLDPDY